MKKRTLFLACLFSALLVLNQSVYAENSQVSQCFLVTGEASTEGVSEQFARRMAIRSALKNATMQNNLKVSSSVELNNFTLQKESTRFSSQSKVSKFKVTHEGVKPLGFEQQFDESGMPVDDKKSSTYQVTLDVCLTESATVCDSALGNYLQPSVAVAQVLLMDAYGARDIANLRSGYQLEIVKRLREKGYRNLQLLHSGSHLQDEQQILSPNLSKAVLDPIRNTTGAQYLLLNVIRSVSRHTEGNQDWNSVKRFYNQSIDNNARYLEVEGFVVDLVSRKVVYQKRQGFDVKGDVNIGRDRPFGTNSFFATDTGMVFHALLDKITSEFNQFLKCKPLKTQIIDIRDGEYILLLSAESGIKVGDEMTVYHQFGRSVTRSGVNLGFDSKPAGFLKITRVQSRFAVAELVSKDGLIQVGDEVLSW